MSPARPEMLYLSSTHFKWAQLSLGQEPVYFPDITPIMFGRILNENLGKKTLTDLRRTRSSKPPTPSGKELSVEPGPS